MKEWTFQTGCGLAGLAVVLGAFGAHTLRGSVPDASLDVWETAVQYHFLHALALIAASLAGPHLSHARAALLAAPLFLAGIALFSGSLYLLVLTGTRWWGAVTPLGGIAFILGWIALALAARR